MKKLIAQIFVCAMIVLSFQCRSAKSNVGHLELMGRTNNLPDGTSIYAVDILTNQVFDSTMIYKNSFVFKKTIKDPPQHIYLHTKDYADTKSLWVENKKIIFDASKDNFEHAKISGSDTQNALQLFLEQIDTVESEVRIENMAVEFIKRHPNSRISASMLAGYAPNLGVEKTSELFAPFSVNNKNSPYGIKISKYISLNKKHDVGDMFTDFEMNNPEGEAIKFSQNLGKVTLLEFWASWCGPCRKQNPDLVKIYDTYNSQGFEILSVSLDFTKENWEKAIKQDGLRWTHVSDLKGRDNTAGLIYGVNTIPDNYLIGKSGKIIGKYLWGNELIEAIEKELNEH